MSQWIQNIYSPEDLKKVPLEKLPEVAEEYRRFLIEAVSRTGGHLGASLGALELSIALHYVLSSPKDKICWDVGHQAYVHKMITGRREQMHTLRQQDGLSGFPSPFESEHDPFVVGHAGTAISQALGLAVARDLLKERFNVVAVVGDGAMTSGLSYEALNNAGNMKKRMLIILNDNEMSISKNVGAISKYFNKILTNPIYNRIRAEVERQLQHFRRLRKIATAGLEGLKHLLVPGIIFEELGFRYFGPINGHDIVPLVKMIEQIVALDDCCFLHVLTKKGKGCDFAEQDSERLHGVTPFNLKTGEKIKSPEENKPAEHPRVSYTEAFSEAILSLAGRRSDLVAVTAAMPTGTGLAAFQKEFPDRFFDVGIAEEHAVTFSGALAKGGMKPVCAIYSTFCQRSHDNLMHDVSLQRLPLILCLDRAGLVGADGPTHHGVFDIAYLAHVPRAVIAAPKDGAEMEQMLALGAEYPDLFVIRYPRAEIPSEFRDLSAGAFPVGKGEILCEGTHATLLALGSMVIVALEAARRLAQEGIFVRVVNMRFAKPLDGHLILESAEKTGALFTLEEHVLSGGFGARVLEFLESSRAGDVFVKRLALPDEFIEHGSRERLLDRFGLSPQKVAGCVGTELRARPAFLGTGLPTARS